MNDLSSVIKKMLRTGQFNALRMIDTYLSENDHKTNDHALVKMPTGTGKSGVMASIIAIHKNYDRAMIVVPNSILPKQIFIELTSRFWETISVDKNIVDINNVYLQDKITVEKLEETDRYTVIVTIQYLLKIKKEKIELYNYLKDKINLVLYDEGHREPAHEWSKVTRDFSVKTILFTATPYRNDELKFKFQIDNEQWKYSYSMADSIGDEVINKVEFVPLSLATLNSITAISNKVSKIIEESGNEKIIIRLKDHKKIMALVKVLNQNGIRALGCHSAITTNGGFYINSGHKIYDLLSDFDVYIHEDMLIEGVDVPEINHLIIVDDFYNTKSLVQQIGRAIRKSESGISKIYVGEYVIDKYRTQWGNYITYDKDPNECDIRYISGEFKSRFRIDNKFFEHLNIPLSANIYSSEKSIFDESINSIYTSLENLNSVVILEQYRENDIWTVCYEKIRYSDILIDLSYEERTLEFTLICEVKKDDNSFFLFYYDSWGHTFDILDVNEESCPIKPNLMYNLLSLNTEITNVKMGSMKISRTNINTRQISGQNIENINSDIGERLSYCKSAKGRIEKVKGEKKNRYISASTGKINDFSYVPFNEYKGWANEVVSEIISRSQNEYFRKFSRIYTGNPTTLKPSSVMINLRDLIGVHNEFQIEDILYSGVKSIKNSISNIICNVKSKAFSFTFDGEKYNGTIKNVSNGKIELAIPKLDRYKVKFIDGNIEKLDVYINKVSCFNVFFSDKGIIYADKNYYEPNISFSNTELSKFNFGQRIFSIPELADCCEEKFGSRPAGLSGNVTLNNWPQDSVFGVLIDHITNNKGHFVNYDFSDIICDDLQAEIADFIAISEADKKIVLIHCKHKGSKYSASAFQDVCGQAQKNVFYLVKNNISNFHFVDVHKSRWNSNWKSQKPKVYSSKGRKKLSLNIEHARIVKGSITGEEFWEKYKEILADVDAKLEVWLFTSGLSKSALESELRKPIPQEQITPLMWLLLATDDVVSQVGATLKIFCKE